MENMQCHYGSQIQNSTLSFVKSYQLIKIDDQTAAPPPLPPPLFWTLVSMLERMRRKIFTLTAAFSYSFLRMRLKCRVHMHADV